MRTRHSKATVNPSTAKRLYNAGTDELVVDAPGGMELTSINIDSAAIFTAAWAANLGGSFDNANTNIFKATFGSVSRSVNAPGSHAQRRTPQRSAKRSSAVVTLGWSW